jgi:hypothetical protein
MSGSPGTGIVYDADSNRVGKEIRRLLAAPGTVAWFLVHRTKDQGQFCKSRASGEMQMSCRYDVREPRAAVATTARRSRGKTGFVRCFS